MWLKKGECLHSLGRLDEAAFAYAQVVNLAPNHLDARLILASLHQQLGRPNQALDILSGEKLNFLLCQQQMKSSSEASCFLLERTCFPVRDVKVMIISF